MSTLLEMAAGLREPKSIIDDACDTIDRAKLEILTLRTRVHQLEVTLARMVAEHEETESNTEGRYPSPDFGCLECTLGTVPDRHNMGLCGYHRAKELLR